MKELVEKDPLTMTDINFLMYKYYRHFSASYYIQWNASYYIQWKIQDFLLISLLISLLLH